MKLQKTSAQNIEEILHFQADILNNIRDCVIVTNLEGKIIYWNKGAEKLYGYLADEVLGQFISILYSDDITNFKRDLEYTENSIKNGVEVTGIFNGRKKDGSLVSADFRRNYLKDEEGNVIGFISVSRDVTELKKAEEYIKNANLYHRGLIEANLDPLVTIGPDGKINDVNRSTEAITGYSRQHLVGTDFSDYFTEPEKARKGYQKVFEDGIVEDYELKIKHKKGLITPVSYNASVYKDENGEVIGVFAAARDITERKIAEKALQAAHDILEIKV
ncbi:MAG TPA: PAS domain-containing protein, partial [Methanobacterium sp.]|nr:PAS domain-containing protein [Methanobacterium sp.]